MAGRRGFVDSEKHSVYGFWDSYVVSLYDAEGDRTDFSLGGVRDGSLTVSRTFATVQSVTYPQTAERMIPTGASMSATGNALEARSVQVMNLLCGHSIADTDNSIGIGAACGSQVYFGLTLQRRPCADDDQIVEAHIWKAHVAGDMEFGSGEEVALGFEITALNDANGDYGGSDVAPLGTIYVPDSGVSMALDENIVRLGIDDIEP